MRSERSLPFPRSTTSAFAFSTRTAARRTVHTLIGSYVGLRTRTRLVPGPCPPVAEPRPAGVRIPWVRVACLLMMGRILTRGRTGPARNPDGLHRVAAQHPDRLRLDAQRLDRRGDDRILGRALEVEEEHVAAQAAAPGARLDPSQVDAAARELEQRLDQRPRVVLAKRREHQSGAPRAAAGGAGVRGGAAPQARPGFRGFLLTLRPPQ